MPLPFFVLRLPSLEADGDLGLQEAISLLELRTGTRSLLLGIGERHVRAVCEGLVEGDGEETVVVHVGEL